MKDLNALLQSAQQTPLPKSDPVNVVIGGELVTFEFTRAEAHVWAHNCAQFPESRVTTSVELDAVYGYNHIQASMVTAGKTGVMIVEDDGENGGRQPVSEEQWRAIFAPGILAGHDLKNIVDAIWGLNEWDPQSEVATLGKASRVDSATSSSSPESSESPAAD